MFEIRDRAGFIFNACRFFWPQLGRSGATREEILAEGETLLWLAEREGLDLRQTTRAVALGMRRFLGYEYLVSTQNDYWRRVDRFSINELEWGQWAVASAWEDQVLELMTNGDADFVRAVVYGRWPGDERKLAAFEALESGCTVSEAARRAGVSPAAVRNWRRELARWLSHPS
jgi:hypothetical protein